MGALDLDRFAQVAHDHLEEHRPEWARARRILLLFVRPVLSYHWQGAFEILARGSAGARGWYSRSS